MKLLIDIGNSRIKWAAKAYDAFEPGAPFAWKAETAQPAVGLEAEFARHWGHLSEVAGVWVVNVAGNEIGDRVGHWCRQARGVVPRFVHSAPAAHGIVNRYRDPAQLGADRFAAMVGARSEHEGPFCVVDCGTALTVDAVNAQGEFVGGVISPGLQLMRQALSRGTQALRDSDGDGAETFPRDTRSAIAAGTVHALIGCIEHAVGCYRSELGGDPLCLLTGGEAAVVRGRLAIPHRFEPHLVLKGLAVITEGTP